MNSAGWYRDPSGRDELRYWDGAHWTDQVAPDDVRAAHGAGPRWPPFAAGTAMSSPESAGIASVLGSPPHTPKHVHRRFRWGLALAIAVLAIGVAASFTLGAFSSGGARELRGTYTVEDDQDANLHVGSTCTSGRDPSSRLEVGRPVIVESTHGEILGRGALRSGVRVNGSTPNGWISYCRFSFAFDVADSKAFALTVGATGPVIYTKAQLESADWRVALDAWKE
jgi:hypothetical protein